MKNRKISIITSSIAACAILASIISFNGFSTENKPTGTAKAENSIIAVKAATTTVQAAAPVNTNTTCAKTAASVSPTTKSKTCSNNTQANVKSANTTNATNNVKNTVTNSNCAKTAATNTNCSPSQLKLNELMKTLNCSSVKPAASCTAASKPSTSASTKNTAKPAASTPAVNGDFSAFQKKVVDLVNKERAKNGLKALTMNASLNKTATLKSQDMAKLNYFDHNSPTYGSPFNMMKNYGISYRTAGENIAMGQTTPEQVMQGWMNSPGHRANILKASYTQIGVGIAKNSSGRLYWTQQFIG